jgi:hypothetical protein
MDLTSTQLNQLIDELQLKHDVMLSPSARHALTAPLLEAQDFQSSVSNDEAKQSLRTIIGSSAALIDPLSGDSRTVTSLRIQQAIHENFCNIPPFCAPLRARGDGTQEGS